MTREETVQPIGRSLAAEDRKMELDGGRPARPQLDVTATPLEKAPGHTAR